jgi:hypothetical protein
MRKPLLLSALFATTLSFAQNEQETDSIQEGWSTDGVFQFLFNQSAFNAEWQGGGTSNIAGNATLNYDANYLKGRHSWDNKLILEYGITKQDEDVFSRKTNDRIEFNSVYGYKISKDSSWSYSFFVNGLTQFAKGYRFSEDPVTGEEIRTERTRFMSPGFFQIGPGVLYRRDEDLTVNIAPATSRFVIVDSEFTTTPGYMDGDYFGVDAGESMRFELGASINALYNFTIAKSITMDNVLLLYMNYLEDVGNVDINYSTNINMKINEWLSTNFIFQAIYDDNAVGAFQVRQVFGLGVNYKF